MNTGRFFPGLDSTDHKDTKLIQRVTDGLKEEMPAKPNGWKLIKWSEGGPWVPPVQNPHEPSAVG